MMDCNGLKSEVCVFFLKDFGVRVVNLEVKSVKVYK